MSKRIVLLIVLLLVSMWAALQINEARRLRDHVLAGPRAKQPITSKDKAGNVVQTTWGEFALSESSKSQLNWVDYQLVNTDSSILWASIYALAGLSGGCLYLLLLVVAPAAVADQGSTIDQAFQAGRLLARLCVSAAAGALSFLVAILPAQVAILSIKLPGIGSTSESGVYGGLLLLPAAAGIFISTFFSRLKSWLEKTMNPKGVNTANPASAKPQHGENR